MQIVKVNLPMVTDTGSSCSDDFQYVGQIGEQYVFM